MILEIAQNGGRTTNCEKQKHSFAHYETLNSYEGRHPINYARIMEKEGVTDSSFKQENIT